MSTLSDVLAEHSVLSGAAVAHLQTVVSEWQLLADLSFSDLLLWVPTEADLLICAAQARPTTGVTAFADDRVSALVSFSDFPLLRHAWEEERVMSEEPPIDVPGNWIRRQVIPVRYLDEVIAVIERDTSSMVGRESSLLETAYVDAADDLFQMIADGTFPPAENPGEMHTGPRAGDGLLRLDADGKVVYVSPNALSAYHRLAYNGEVIGQKLAVLTRPLIDDPFDAAELIERIEGAVQGMASLRMEVEAKAATVLFRAMPLRPHGRLSGALVLVRDVTEVRRRDRALLSKDATIREIHHRVKNNLQTVAALLRMQARRISSPEVQVALNDAMSRVASIAIVHETLSQAYDEIVEFDRVADGLLRMVGEVAASWGGVSAVRRGSFGLVSADMATSLAMVITELCQNAIEHGLADRSGEVRVVPSFSDRRLRVEISDDGRGLPENFDWRSSRSLGLSIVNTLVEELEGQFELGPQPDGPGTRAVVEIPI
jgi:two-component sensor histidine kinase/PAS domain-containing protein